MPQTNQPLTRGVVESAFNERQLAIKWAITPKTLQSWRLTGGGPKFVKLGKAVRYLADDVAAFEAANTHSSTTSVAS